MHQPSSSFCHPFSSIATTILFLQGEVENHANTIGGVSIAVFLWVFVLLLLCIISMSILSFVLLTIAFSVQVLFTTNLWLFLLTIYLYNDLQGDCHTHRQHDHRPLYVRLWSRQVTSPRHIFSSPQLHLRCPSIKKIMIIAIVVMI